MLNLWCVSPTKQRLFPLSASLHILVVKSPRLLSERSRTDPLPASLHILIVKGQTIQSNRLPFDFLTFSNFFSLLFWRCFFLNIHLGIIISFHRWHYLQRSPVQGYHHQTLLLRLLQVHFPDRLSVLRHKPVRHHCWSSHGVLQLYPGFPVEQGLYWTEPVQHTVKQKKRFLWLVLG